MGDTSHATGDAETVDPNVDVPLEPPGTLAERYFQEVRYFCDSKRGDQYVLQHSNGICAIGLASSHPLFQAAPPVKITFRSELLNAKPSGKKKLGASWLNALSPICDVHCADGTVFTCCSGVRGNLYELNTRLTREPQLLVQSPESAGYLALIMPKKAEKGTVHADLLDPEQFAERKRKRRRDDHRSPTMFTMLDGGNGHMLRRLGVSIEGEVGSLQRFLGVALANKNQSELVLEAHRAFIKAGASVITTNTYSCIPRCLELDTARRSDYLDLIHSGCKLAVKAKEEALASENCVSVAGCVPPLTASYRPDQVLKSSELEANYSEITSALAQYVDLFLVETMSLEREALAAATAASKHGLPVWLSFIAVESDPLTLPSGEQLVAAAQTVAKHTPNLVAVLVNCCTPEAATLAIPNLRSALPNNIAVGMYPNAFATSGNGDTYSSDLTPANFADLTWSSLHCGATIVGGCCGIFPEHLQESSKFMLKKALPMPRCLYRFGLATEFQISPTSVANLVNSCMARTESHILADTRTTVSKVEALMAKNSGSEFLVAQSTDGELASVVRVDAVDDGIMFIGMVATADCHQRRGLASWLVRNAQQRAKKRSASWLALHFPHIRTDMERWYSRLGFSKWKEESLPADMIHLVLDELQSTLKLTFMRKAVA